MSKIRDRLRRLVVNVVRWSDPEDVKHEQAARKREQKISDRIAKDFDALLEACKELCRYVGAAIRVVSEHQGVPEEMIQELEKIGVPPGSIARAQAAIDNAEGDGEPEGVEE